VREHRIQSSDGTTVVAYEAGSPAGAPILFIHGYLFSAAAFSRQMEGPLGRHHRLVAVNLRGHGESDKPRDLMRYANATLWADDIDCVMNGLEIDRALIVGWSLGSRVALNYAWVHGFSRIAVLNLVAATLATNSHGPSGCLPPALIHLLAEDFEARHAATAAFMKVCSEPGRVDNQSLKSFLAEAMKVPVEARLGSRIWALPYDNDLRWITTPTLITHGIRDPVVTEELSRSHATSIAGATLAIISDAGHMPFFQNPEMFDNSLMELASRAF
jgi:non-heme chloroperoxidase